MGIVLLCALVQILFISVVRSACWNDWDSTVWGFGQEWAVTEYTEYLFNKACIPEEVSYDAIPPTIIKISFGSEDVGEGALVPQTETITKPTVEWYCNENLAYTLIMIDPRALGTAKGKQFLHWKVDNICGCDLKHGDTVADYLAPGPPPGTGRHPYIILMFVTGNCEDTDETSPFNEVKGNLARPNFDTDMFIQDVGCPLAGSYFLVKSPVLGDSTVADASQLNNPIEQIM